MERIFSALKVSVVSDDVSDLKIIDKLVSKLSMSRRVSQKYGVLQLNY